LRIISGRAKGLQLNTPPGKSLAIRPTSDRSREALFSILGGNIDQARVLDLYAGTGAFGLEALSRGAASAVFVDNSPTSLDLIRKNIVILQKCLNLEPSQPDISIIKCDLRKGLQPVSRKYSGDANPFDIIFLDPPYDKNLAQQTLEHLDDTAFLAEDGLIVAEERAKAVLSVEFKIFRLLDKRRYGDTGFWIYTAR